MRRSPWLFVVLIPVALILLFEATFIVDEARTAIVIQLGNPRDTIYGPGLHFKLPFVQTAVQFDARILDYDARQAETITSDKKSIVIDNYVRWRIIEPLTFYRSLRTVTDAQDRIDYTVYSQLRVFIGNHTLKEVVSGRRGSIIEDVTQRAADNLKEYGIEVIDVRIKRADVPKENQRAIFERMRAERMEQAKRYRSEGESRAMQISSEAERDRAIILAEAQRTATILRGEGDAEAAHIFAEALSQSPEFYSFQRSLEAYRHAFKENSRIILTPNDPFMRYFASDR